MPSPYWSINVFLSRVKVLDRPEYVPQSLNYRDIFVFINLQKQTISYSKQFSLSLDIFLGVYCFCSPFGCDWYCFYFYQILHQFSL